ncbi:hypothetical protein LBMAG49_14500 [Planctomycetota bacterium]|jgi:hypothetical protein|nr:hypothetical protein [Planctomycetota bacterium]GDY02121.1 hypothetical protein LBMAG49_14500 [Planctomycetota bacterium]
MARSRRQNGGPTRDTFKKKRMGKGWASNNSKPKASRPVLRITEPLASDIKKD